MTELVAPGVVNTMPEATLREVADHGRVPADSVRSHYDDAERVLAGLRTVGVDYGDLVQTLQEEGVSKFDASWEQLSERLAETLRSRPAARGSPSGSGATAGPRDCGGALHCGLVSPRHSAGSRCAA
ncbi:transaldolase family protein [Streptomyces sp. NPDC019990]|uniref:transaldolase family protein n=1 Tax=Streptomyces sp. NPDC019990 TaxID=3154693 RepID=UPI00340A09F3